MQCFSKLRQSQELWRNFFANPHQWRDLRSIKKNKKFPDFVHRTTKVALWIDSPLTPAWVGAELDKLNGYSISSSQNASFGNGLVSGNTIRKLLKDGKLGVAFQAADTTSQQGCVISTSIAFCLLQGCIEKKDLAVAKKLHGFLERNGFLQNLFIGCHLIRAYAACKSLSDARHVFCGLLEQDIFTWTAIISAHEELGQCELAITLYHRMQEAYVEADAHLFVAVLRACTNLESFYQGQLVHAHIIFNGLEACVHVGSALVDMYSKCGSFEDGHSVISKLPKPSAVTWNSLIGGCAQHGNGHQALLLFHIMQHHDVKPNAVTFVCVLQACSNLTNIQLGMLIHAYASESNFEVDVFVGSVLIDMYARCGSLADAQTVFGKLPKHDPVTWSAMMTGHAHHRQGDEALFLYEQLVQQGLEPNGGVFINALKACTCTSADYNVYYIHGHVVESGYDIDENVSSMLIDIHAKHGSLQDAWSVFADVMEQGVVPWTSMMGGYFQHGNGQESVKLFEQMQQEAHMPNLVTLICALNACSSIAALLQGKRVHARVIASGCSIDDVVGIALINMYKSCGSLMSAAMVFDHFPKHSIEIWTAIIVACAEHGDFKLALDYFRRMEQTGLKPDDVSFVCLLSACCHGGQVRDGCLVFRSLIEKHVRLARNDHYNAMIGVLGGCGYLMEAADLLATMPTLPNAVGWTALLAHSKTHSNEELGERCFVEVAVAVDQKMVAYA